MGHFETSAPTTARPRAARQFEVSLDRADAVIDGQSNVADYPQEIRGNFENHLIQKDGITLVYDAPLASRMVLRDGDGNRVQKIVAGVTTR